MPHGGKLLIDHLELEGCDTVYCVPGESYLAVLDGLHDSNRIRTVVCRQEGGASMMADAYGKLTGKPGICFVTRGPGAANAMSGIHIAYQDSTPLILFVGLPPRNHRDREAFQEINLSAIFGSTAKWVAVIDDVARINEYVGRAYTTASSGRPGPVVLGLPEDMLTDQGQPAQIQPTIIPESHPSPAAMSKLNDVLKTVKRPLVVVGGPGWSSEVSEKIAIFAERLNLPVAAAFRFQDYFDNRHPNYAGHIGIGVNPRLAERLQSSDFLLAIGPRLGEMTTRGYTLLDIPSPKQYLVHVHPGAEELGSVFRTDLPILSSLSAFADWLAEIEAPSSIVWSDWTKTAHADYEENVKPVETPGALKLEQVVTSLNELLEEDAIIANGAGNFTAWVHRYFRYKAYRTQLAPTSGSMGYGLPAAISAKIQYPHRQVVCFSGDGCFMMTGQEFATAMHYGLPIVIIVVNNQMYGTIRMHQERHFPGRVIATSLTNPNFAEYARSFGAYGAVIERTSEFRPAFLKALKADRPTILELRTSDQAITPTESLASIREEALQSKNSG